MKSVIIFLNCYHLTDPCFRILFVYNILLAKLLVYVRILKLPTKDFYLLHDNPGEADILDFSLCEILLSNQ